MNIIRIFLFSDGFKRLLRQVNILFRTMWRILLSIVKGCKGLRVDSILINDTFLLSNGVIVVQWQLRHAWTIHINGKWFDPGKGYATFYPGSDITELNIRIHGLFRNFRKQFVIQPAGGIDPAAFPLPHLKPALLTDMPFIAIPVSAMIKIPSFKADIRALAVVPGTRITDFNIFLPPIQIPSNHDQRLLHNT